MARRHLLVFCALLAVGLLAVPGSVGAWREPSAQEPVLAIVDGRLFDGTGAPVIEDGVVLIEGNRILTAGGADEVAVPASATTIDAGGGLIMPGVIDNHVHVTTDLAQARDILTPWLRDGVTSLVDTGTVRDDAVIGDVTIEDGIALLRALIDGVAEEPPRMFVAGPILTAPGGYPATRGEQFSALAAQDVTGSDDARARVANLIDEQGADLIKVAIEAGFDADYGDPGWPVLDAETLAAIAEAAHERGRTVRAHVTQPGELRAAIDAGFDVAAHTPTEAVPDALLQQAADADMIFVSTANIWGAEGAAAVQSNLARYIELGGRVALGTDFPFQQGSEMPVKEMQVLMEGGLTPAEVLVAATKHGAEAIGRGDELGTLAPGKLADVIVVDGDPLRDIADMANVTVVVRDGEVIVGEAVQPPAATPATATAAPGLPPSGRGPSDGDWPLWPIIVAALLAAGGLIGVGRLLLPRRRR